MSMPFTPCPDGPCEDQSVLILSEILGPVVTNLAEGQDPAALTSSNELLATLFQYFNSGLLIVGSFIVAYVAIAGAINTANDGEALGKSWSSLWTPVRAVFGCAALLPTVSGFSLIQVAVMMLSMWGVGFANKIYELAMTESVLEPSAIVQGVYHPNNAHGLRGFAVDYLKSSYCARIANELYPGADVRIDLSLPDVSPSTPENDVVRLEYHVKDRGTSGANLASSTPFCGMVTLFEYEPPKSGSSETDAMLRAIKRETQEIKAARTKEMMAEIDAYVAGFPSASTFNSNWTIDSSEFNDIIAYAEKAIIDDLRAVFEESGTTFESAMRAYIASLTREGWAMAGGWYQRVGAIRSAMVRQLSEPVGTTVGPNFDSLPDDARRIMQRSLVRTIPNEIDNKAREKSNDVSSTNMPPLPNANTPISVARGQYASSFSSWNDAQIRGFFEAASGTSDACGTGGLMGGALNRLKCVGDMMAITVQRMEGAQLSADAIKAEYDARSHLIAVSGMEGLPETNEEIVRQVNEKYKDSIIYLKGMAFYFSVFLPSLPYMIFIVVVVGWILSILQSLVAAPLWAVMHLTPERTFVGSQRQGYLLLLALFVRPALAVIGLFAAFLIINPVVYYITKAFFAMREAVVASSGSGLRSATETTTFFWWFFIYGTLLLPVVYMVFSLPQMLPDKVLKWIGAGVEDLGETNALGEMRGTTSAGMRTAAHAGKIGGMGNPEPTQLGGGGSISQNAQTVTSNDGSQKQSTVGGDPRDKLLVSGQGVSTAPEASAASGGDAPQTKSAGTSAATAPPQASPLGNPETPMNVGDGHGAAPPPKADGGDFINRTASALERHHNHPNRSKR
jgi:conjugal transfer/type IV secretion protein DotA/TraY